MSVAINGAEQYDPVAVKLPAVLSPCQQHMLNALDMLGVMLA